MQRRKITFHGVKPIFTGANKSREGDPLLRKPLLLEPVVRQTTAPQDGKRSPATGIPADAQCFKSQGSGRAWARGDISLQVSMETAAAVVF